MIALMKRIVAVSGKYQGRIRLAFVFSFLKSLLSKAPVGLAFLPLPRFWTDVWTVVSVCGLV